MTAVDQHLTALRAGRYSASTLKARAAILATLPCDPAALTRDDVLAWWETRQTRPDGDPKAAASLSAEASHLRAFGRWAIQQGLADRNPADWLPKVRLPKRLAHPISEADLYALLSDAVAPVRQMIALAAMAGLRSSEVAVVRWEDIDRGNGVLAIREGKGKKDRTVPLSAGLLGELGDPGQGLIVGAELTGKAVSLRLGRYLRAHKVDATAHQLRARYATRFLAATGDLQTTANAMGHADVSTTARYTVASSDTMRRGAEAAGRIG